MVDHFYGLSDVAVRLRAEMPVTRSWAYLDHAAVAPISAAARRAIEQWLREASEQGGTAWSSWSLRIEHLRRMAAGLLGARPEEIALVPNTTAGIGLVAEGFPWRDGDNVVTLADEFPSNLYPWMNLASRGVMVRRVPTRDGRLDLKQLEQTCDRRTRIVAISWVGYATGCRQDLPAVAEIARKQGAYLLVDAIQGLGVFPIHAERAGVDFLAADGHKWLLGPEGAGILYVRRKHLDLLRPLGVGWNSVEHALRFEPPDFRLKHAASRYEGGSLNTAGLMGLAGSLELLLELGVDQLAHAVVSITELACELLAAAGARIVSDRRDEHRSGIVAFELPGQNPLDVRRRCLTQQIALSCRAGRLRISPHAYNEREEIERLVEVLSARS